MLGFVMEVAVVPRHRHARLPRSQIDSRRRCTLRTPHPQDYLFLPSYGSALHLLKVEIGGDAQSSEGVGKWARLLDCFDTACHPPLSPP